MPSEKRLFSVAQSTAHHAVSGLCYVVPHLRKACLENQKNRCRIDLLADDSCPKSYRKLNSVHLSINALKEKFIHILKAEGFEIESLGGASLEYEFPVIGDDYTASCCVTIVSPKGKSFQKAIDNLGNTTQIIKTKIG